jgi:PilZ domain
MSERRCAPRTRGHGISARIRPGHRVLVVDVSTGGALLEGMRPLRPGADVEVQLERGHTRVRVSASVVRCGIAAIDPHCGPTYRAAVAFREPLAWVGEAATLGGHALPDAGGQTCRDGSGARK